MITGTAFIVKLHKKQRIKSQRENKKEFDKIRVKFFFFIYVIEVITSLMGDSFSPINVRTQPLGVTTKRPVRS